MGKIKIDKERCKGCLLCIGVCPKGLMVQAKELNRRGVKPAEQKETDAQSCSGCALCAIICPDCCIEVYR
ncbi:MAG: 4Fe-4S binding protein [Candidatus Omnitrophica bacterium]|nr:4Fe-4S binding protein [Candidatus Omnitrophota bacterium]